MTDDMGIRGEATAIDLLAAVKLAVASQDLTSKDRAFDVIAWIIEFHDVGDGRPKSVDLFIEGIKQTKRETAAKQPPNVFTQPGQGGTTIQNPRRPPENIC